MNGSEPTRDSSVPCSLTEQQIAILDFEAAWLGSESTKEQAVLKEFDLTLARYYQFLGYLLDLPAALMYNPLLIRRLQRIRDSHMTERSLRLFERDSQK